MLFCTLFTMQLVLRDGYINTRAEKTLICSQKENILLRIFVILHRHHDKAINGNLFRLRLQMHLTYLKPKNAYCHSGGCNCCSIVTKIFF